MIRMDQVIGRGSLTLKDCALANGAPGLAVYARNTGGDESPALDTSDVEELRDVLNYWLAERGR